MVAVYKKTDRVRKTASHSALEDAVTGIVPVISAMVGAPVEVTLNRSTEQKYARALFDISFGSVVTLTGYTAEQIIGLIQGIRIANELRIATATNSEEARAA